MTPQQYLLIFWARRRVILAIYLFVVVAALAAALSMTKRYTATASLLVDIKNDPIAGTVLPDMTNQSYMTNQVEIVKSDRVAARVIKLLGEGPRQRAYVLWSRIGGAKPAFENFYASWLQNALTVKISPSTNVMSLNFVATDPAFAATAANAYAQAYIDTTIDLRAEPARQYAVWYEERLAGLREALRKAQNKLSAYQTEKGIVTSDARYDQEMERLSALTTKLAEAQGKHIETSYRERNADGDASPEVLENKVIQDIKSELAKAEGKLSELRVTVGANHPQRVQLESQIAMLRQRLAEETQRIFGAAATANRASAQTEAELKALVAAQEKKVLSLLAQHGEMTVLVKEVETAQHAYDAVAERMNMVNLESKAENGNVSVLSPAVAPSSPSHPKTLLIFLVSHPGGLLLGLLVSLGLESLDGRVRSVRDFGSVDNLPVLGSLRPEPQYLSFTPRLAFSGASASLRRSLPFIRTEPK